LAVPGLSWLTVATSYVGLFTGEISLLVDRNGENFVVVILHDGKSQFCVKYSD